MKPKNTDLRHELLSELHRLLSIASSEDFIAASNLCTSENIKLALLALAEEHLADDRDGRHRSRPRSQVRRENKTGEKNAKNTPLPSTEPSELFFRSPLLATKGGLMQFANTHGFNVPPDNKDSRDRLIGRLLRQFGGMSGSEQARIMSDLSGENADPQTTGWMQVIRKRG